MCIFSKPVDRVSETKIVYALLGSVESGGRWVVTAYSNAVQLTKGSTFTTMLLPVPALHTSVVLLNREGDKTMENTIQCLHEMFQEEQRQLVKSKGRGRSRLARGERKLAVINSGAYSVSLVPDHGSLNRLDTDTFEVSAELSETLKHYENGFSFLAFKLRASSSFHPFTYAYPLRDDCRSGFIPTRHFHPPSHAAESSSSSATPTTKSSPSSLGMTDDWDHEIYVLGVDSNSLEGIRPKRQRLVMSMKVRVLYPLMQFIAQAVGPLPAASSDSTEHHETSALQSFVRLLTGGQLHTTSAASAASASIAGSSTVSASAPLPIRDLATQYVIHGRHQNMDVIFELSDSSGASSTSDLAGETAVDEDEPVGNKRKASKRVDVGKAADKKVESAKGSDSVQMKEGKQSTVSDSSEPLNVTSAAEPSVPSSASTQPTERRRYNAVRKTK